MAETKGNPKTVLEFAQKNGAEAEFFIFDNVRFDQKENQGFHFIDAEEGHWNSGRQEHNLDYRPGHVSEVRNAR